MDRLPAKPALAVFALSAVLLAAAGRFASAGASGAREARRAVDGGDAAGRREALEALGLDPAGLEALLGEGLDGQDRGDAAPAPHAAEAVRADRPAGWTYPPFETPEEGLHGAPAAARPRSVHVRLVDGAGQPFVPDRLAAVQNGPDGRHELEGTRAAGAVGHWILGTPALTTGSAASFEVTAWCAGAPWTGVCDLLCVGTEVELEVAAPVRLLPAAPR